MFVLDKKVYRQPRFGSGSSKVLKLTKFYKMTLPVVLDTANGTSFSAGSESQNFLWVTHHNTQRKKMIVFMLFAAGWMYIIPVTVWTCRFSFGWKWESGSHWTHQNKVGTAPWSRFHFSDMWWFDFHYHGSCRSPDHQGYMVQSRGFWWSTTLLLALDKHLKDKPQSLRTTDTFQQTKCQKLQLPKLAQASTVQTRGLGTLPNLLQSTAFWSNSFLTYLNVHVKLKRPKQKKCTVFIVKVLFKEQKLSGSP